MRFPPALLLAAALLSAPVAAQVDVGADAPEIDAKDWFNPPPGSSLAELRGQVVLIEFWATW